MPHGSGRATAQNLSAVSDAGSSRSNCTIHARRSRVARNGFADKFLIRLEGTMSPRTLFLSKLIGLYCILVALSMITRRQATLESVTALLQNPSMMLILGVITLAAGLAMVLAHNIWSGGALVVVVTLVGWITLIKSLLFLFLPPDMQARLFFGQVTTDNSSTCTQPFPSSSAST